MVDVAAAVLALTHAAAVSCGHYYAYARDACGTWRTFNDSYVTDVPLQTVLRTGSAYLLFYQRMHPPMPPLALPSSTSPAAPRASSLKRTHAHLPEAAKAVKARLLSDGSVAALEAQLRASELMSMLRNSLRLVRSRLRADATRDELVAAWRAEGHSKDVRHSIGETAPLEAKGFINRAIAEMQAQAKQAA